MTVLDPLNAWECSVCGWQQPLGSPCPCVPLGWEKEYADDEGGFRNRPRSKGLGAGVFGVERTKKVASKTVFVPKYEARQKLNENNYWYHRNYYLMYPDDLERKEKMLATVTETYPDLDKVAAEPWSNRKIKRPRKHLTTRGRQQLRNYQLAGIIGIYTAYVLLLVTGAVYPAIALGIVGGVAICRFTWTRHGR